MRKFFKKEQKREWSQERQKEFKTYKEEIKNIPKLAHFNSFQNHIVTTDASTHGLGAILWREQKDKSLKPILFAIRFLNDAEKKYAINELELLVVVCGLEQYRFSLYGREKTLKTTIRPYNRCYGKMERTNNTAPD